MLRRGVLWCIVLTGIFSVPARAWGEDDERPPEYAQGRQLLEESLKTDDYEKRQELLSEARRKIASFAAQNPTHKLAIEATIQLARVLVESGHLATLRANELGETQKEAEPALLQEARTSFDEARETYRKAILRLKQAFEAYPNFIPENDPRREQRSHAHAALMDAQLQKAVVDYEESQTYELGSQERNRCLDAALVQFDELYKKYRTQMAGLVAHMWQGKCHEEKGELGKALGIYKALLEHSDPRLRDLQRHVAFFQIIAERKREMFTLAADDCDRWLQRFNTREERHSHEGLGVLLEKAKNIIAQLPTALDEAERNQMIGAALESAREVVKFATCWKREASAIIEQYAPKEAGINGNRG